MRSESPRSHHTHINEAGAGGVRVSIMERSSDQVYLHGYLQYLQYLHGYLHYLQYLHYLHTYLHYVNYLNRYLHYLNRYLHDLQIIRPINTAALSEWAEDDTFSPKLLKRMAEVAPMLRSLQLTLVNTQQSVIAGSWVTTLTRTRPATGSRTR